MRRFANIAKWIAVAVVAAEWYSRRGREFVFGEETEEWGIGETIRTWVPLPQGVEPPTTGVPGPLVNNDGDEIGVIHRVRVDDEAVDMAGHRISRTEVFVEVLSDAVSRPINVALAEIESLTRKALGV